MTFTGCGKSHGASSELLMIKLAAHDMEIIMKTKSYWNRRIIIAGMMPAIIAYLVLNIYPSFMTAIYSFTDISGVQGAGYKFIGLQNYIEFFVLQNYRDSMDAMKRTLLFAVAVTLIQNFFAILIAVLLNKKRLKGRNFFRAIVFLPSVLGVTVCCYAWSLFFTMDGPASVLLSRLGGFSSFLGDRAVAFPLVIFIQIWMSVGYAMVIYIAGLQSIPLELYEAAQIDGAGGIKTFFRITFPLLWPTVTVNVLLSVIGSLSSVQTILLTTGGANDTSTLATRIFRAAFGIGSENLNVTGAGTLRQGYASALSMILFVIILFVTILTQTYLNRRDKL